MVRFENFLKDVDGGLKEGRGLDSIMSNVKQFFIKAGVAHQEVTKQIVKDVIFKVIHIYIDMCYC